MTHKALATLEPRVEAGDGYEALLSGLIDWPMMRRLGWDAVHQVFAPGPEDPVFGFAVCKTAGCDRASCSPIGLCFQCQGRWRQLPQGTDFEEFCRQPPGRPKKRRGESLCRVCRTPGHERPASLHGLCSACSKAAAERGQPVDAYVDGDGNFPPAAPRPSFGKCRVRACDRWACHRDPPLCNPHRLTLGQAGRPEGQAFGEWCGKQPAANSSRQAVVLRGLSQRVQLEVLYGLQGRAQAERKTRTTTVQAVADLLRAEGAASIFDLRVNGLYEDQRQFLTFTTDRVTLALADPATETGKDDWDLRVFARPTGRLHFSQIQQPWLKETAKHWALGRLAAVEGAKYLDRQLQALGLFSESLARHRRDGGRDPAELSRADVVAFSNDLAHLEAAARLSRPGRRSALKRTGQVFTEARGMGLSRPGGPMAGLPEDVGARHSEHIPEQPKDEQGRALPQVVIDQLLEPAALDLLEAMCGPDARAMVELQARVGRRTGELCQLHWDCLLFEEVLDELGQAGAAPVLVHDMPKVSVRNYHLPIDQDTAEVIRAQQARVTARYPGTPTSQLALFPTAQKNPRGVKPTYATAFCVHLRSWSHSLPELRGPGGEDYVRSTITPYSFRHSFAQRHADSGTPVEVLAALMGHTRLTTTQVYYRVTQKRKRKAVDVLAKLQVDCRGDRSRAVVEQLLDSEHLRDAVGQVAVPFGICREPSNVKAHGQACPFRHQCFGCTHFRTDPSFLAELRAYLGRLLADRERLRAAAPELEQWARNAAIPSREEIAAVRRLVDRCEELLGDLDADAQAEVGGAIAALRRTRAQLDATVPVRFLGLVRQSSPTLFPNLRREREPVDDT